MLAKSLHPILAALIACVAASVLLAAEVPDDPKLTRPLQVDARLPQFTVRTAEGAPFQFDPAKLSAPVILIFYRGGWCPYCNSHLAALRDTEPKLLQMGFDVLFLSADSPEMLRSSLQEADIRYTLLSDNRLDAARALGIAFRVDDATVEKYRSFGVDLEKASGETHHQLPVPSVFLADRNGVIRFVYSNPDYKLRIKSEELLAAASAAAPGTRSARRPGQTEIN